MTLIRAPQRAWLILPHDQILRVVDHFRLHTGTTRTTLRPFVPAPEETWFAAAVRVGNASGLLDQTLWETPRYGGLNPWDWVWTTRNPAHAQTYAGIGAAGGGRAARRTWPLAHLFEAEYFDDAQIAHYQRVRERVEQFHREQDVLHDLAAIE